MLVVTACWSGTTTVHILQESNGVKVQVGMVLDGSGSISGTNWDIMVTGLAAAVNSSDCMPHDGSVELTVIQFGGYSSPGAQLEMGPVVITAANAADAASNITAISQMGGYTPLSCGMRLAADTLAASSNFHPDIKQAINIVTDGVPNRCCPGTWDCIPGSGSCSTGGCDEAYDSAVAARNYTITTLNMTDDQDEIDVEGIGITEANRDWFKNSIILPATGYSNPPEGWPPPGPGWVRVFATFDEFIPSLCEKFEIIVYGSITAHKFNDLNGDGDQDVGEGNLAGWNMTLYSGPDCSGSPLASNETDADGNVFFSGLEAGNYSVKETLESGWTNSTALCQQVTVDTGESATLNFGNLCVSPTAAFSATPTSGCEPSLIVTFTDQSSGNPTSWNWTFPGGSPSSHTGQTPPAVNYSSAGSYDVTLSVSNACGSDDETKSNYITVYANPTADAGLDKEICAGGSVQLSGSATGGTSPYTYDWTGPESHPNTQNPSVSTTGTYTLNVTDDNGCSDTDDVIVSQYLSPTADAGGDTGFCAGGSVQLSGSATGGTSPYTYDWTGPESHPNTQNPSVSTTGTYTLNVTDDNGCSDTDDVIVSQYLSPTGDAGPDRQILCGAGSVVIGGTPTASGGTPTYTYSWTPISGLDNASFANPTASPAVNTTYTVTVTDSNGCTDSDDVTVTVTTCCICGFVYRTGTMQPLPGWEVILEKQTNPWVQVGSPAITDANGKYCFCGLEIGDYRVSEVVQPNWSQVSPLPNQHLVTLPGGASDPATGPFFSFENEQGGPFTVGWEASPIDKLAVLAPWIVLFSLIVAGASLVAVRRRRI